MKQSPARLGFALSGLVLTVLAATGVSAQPLEQLVPDTSLFLFKVRSGSELMRKWRTTGYYEFWNHRDMRQALGGLAQMVEMQSRSYGAMLGLGDRGIEPLFANQYGIAVCPPPLGAGTDLEIVALIQAGGLAETALNGVADVMKAQSGGANPFEKHGEVNLLQFSTPAFSAGLAAVRGFLVAAVPFPAIKNAVNRIQSPPPEPLASGRTFAPMAKRLGDDYDVLLFADVPALFERLRENPAFAGSGDVMRTLGLDSVGALAGTLKIGGDGIHMVVHVRLSGERKGVFRLLAPSPVAAAPAAAGAVLSSLVAADLSPTDQDVRSPAERRRELMDIIEGKVPIRGAEEAPAERPAQPAKTQPEGQPKPEREDAAPSSAGAVHLGETIPGDAALFSAYRVNPVEAWATVQEVLQALNPPAAAAFAGQADLMAQKAGKGNISELLQEFGERIVSYTRYSKPYMKADSQQTVAFIEIRSRKSAESVLETLRTSYPEVFLPGQPATAFGVEIYQVAWPGVPKHGAYCLTDRYVAIASDVNALREYFSKATVRGEWLSRQQDFASALRKMPPADTATAISYSNPAPALTWLVACIKAGQVNGVPVQVLPFLAPTIEGIKKVNNFHVIAALLPVQAAGVTSDQDGITFVSWHALRGSAR